MIGNEKYTIEAAPPKMGQVQEQLNQLDMCIGDMMNSVEALLGRIYPILQDNNDPPNPQGGVDICLVPTAHAIRNQRYRIQEANRMLISALERIEL